MIGLFKIFLFIQELWHSKNNQRKHSLLSYRIFWQRRPKLKLLCITSSSSSISSRRQILIMKKLWKMTSMMSWGIPSRASLLILIRSKYPIRTYSKIFKNLSRKSFWPFAIFAQLTIISITLLDVARWSRNFFPVNADCLFLSMVQQQLLQLKLYLNNKK